MHSASASLSTQDAAIGICYEPVHVFAVCPIFTDVREVPVYVGLLPLICEVPGSSLGFEIGYPAILLSAGIQMLG